MDGTVNKAILINTIEKVRDFEAKASRCSFDMDIESGHYCINAKSLMGLFSLDIAKPVKLKIYASEECATPFLKEIADYIEG